MTQNHKNQQRNQMNRDSTTKNWWMISSCKWHEFFSRRSKSNLRSIQMEITPTWDHPTWDHPHLRPPRHEINPTWDHPNLRSPQLEITPTWDQSKWRSPRLEITSDGSQIEFKSIKNKLIRVQIRGILQQSTYSESLNEWFDIKCI